MLLIHILHGYYVDPAPNKQPCYKRHTIYKQRCSDWSWIWVGAQRFPTGLSPYPAVSCSLGADPCLSILKAHYRRRGDRVSTERSRTLWRHRKKSISTSRPLLKHNQNITLPNVALIICLLQRLQNTVGFECRAASFLDNYLTAILWQFLFIAINCVTLFYIFLDW